MQTFAKTTSVIVMSLMILVAQFPALAFNAENKTVEKARELVNSSAPDDWQALAKAAQMCINKSVNLTEAKSWLEKSLTIKETALGHEVAGDYYMNSKLYSKAINHYVKSMKKIKEKDNTADLSDLQAKIEKAVLKSKE